MCSNVKLSISCQVKDVINRPKLVKVDTILERCMWNRFFYSISPIRRHVDFQIRTTFFRKATWSLPGKRRSRRLNQKTSRHWTLFNALLTNGRIHLHVVQATSVTHPTSRFPLLVALVCFLASWIILVDPRYLCPFPGFSHWYLLCGTLPLRRQTIGELCSCK